MSVMVPGPCIPTHRHPPPILTTTRIPPWSKSTFPLPRANPKRGTPIQQDQLEQQPLEERRRQQQQQPVALMPWDKICGAPIRRKRRQPKAWSSSWGMWNKQRHRHPPTLQTNHPSCFINCCFVTIPNFRLAVIIKLRPRPGDANTNNQNHNQNPFSRQQQQQHPPIPSVPCINHNSSRIHHNHQKRLLRQNQCRPRRRPRRLPYPSCPRGRVPCC